MKKKLSINSGWWINDTTLNTVSYSARGVLSVLMCLANNPDAYGTIMNGKGDPLTEMEIRLILPGDGEERDAALTELYKKDFLRKEGSRIIIPNMIEEEKRADIYRKNGSKGGNPSLIKSGYTDDGKFRTKKGRHLSGAQLKAFEIFWEKFGYKKGKASAADAWHELEVNKVMFEDIIRGALKENSRRKMLIDKGRTPIFPEGWLRQRRWEDEDE